MTFLQGVAYTSGYVVSKVSVKVSVDIISWCVISILFTVKS